MQVQTKTRLRVKLRCQLCPLRRETGVCALRGIPVRGQATCPFGTLLTEHREVLGLLDRLYREFADSPSTLIDEVYLYLRRKSQFQKHIDQARLESFQEDKLV